MIKKITSVLLVIAILSSFTITVYARSEESAKSDQFYDVEVTLRDCDYGTEPVRQTFMIPKDESGVYIMAENIVELLSLYDIFFNFEMTYTQCAIASDFLGYAVMFKFNSDEVSVYAAGELIEYESPLPSIYKNGVAWLPFEFVMRLFNCSYDVDSDGIYVQKPNYSPLMVISALYKSNYYSFDFVNEYGLSGFSAAVMDGSAALVNALSGVISFEGHAWLDLVTLNLANATEKHYAQDIAEMFVAPSSAEVGAADDSVPLLFIEAVGSYASKTGTMNEIVADGFKYSKLDEMLKFVMNKNYNFKYDNRVIAFYAAFKNNKEGIEKISEYIGKAENISGKIFDRLDTFTTLLSTLLEFIQFYLSMLNKNEFASDALKTYCSNTNTVASSTMYKYANTTSKDVGSAVIQYLSDNLLDVVGGTLPLPKLLGAPAAIVLMGWDLLSKYNPFFKSGLESADSFEFAELAIVYQNDARNLMHGYKNEAFAGDSVNEGYLEKLRDYAYSYLKFSVIARSGASKILKNATKITEDNKEIMQNRFDEKNKQIGRFLAALEGEENNGYLPSDVKENKKHWIKDELFEAIRNRGTVRDDISQNYIPIEDLSGVGVITPEEALKMVKRLMGGIFADLIFEQVFKGYLKLEVMNEAIRIQPNNQLVYVVHYIVDGKADDICLLVPVDGSAIWMGWMESDGSYFCYTDVNLADFKWSEFIESIKRMLDEAEKEAEQ